MSKCQYTCPACRLAFTGYRLAFNEILKSVVSRLECDSGIQHHNHLVIVVHSQATLSSGIEY